MNPEISYQVLLVVQALHLLHHRLAKRHISFVEVATGAILCIPPSLIGAPGWLFIVHAICIGIQIVGSIWIKKLSPDWSKRS